MNYQYWKNVPKQTIFSDDPRGGDCYRCCIGAIIGRKAECIPHFLQISTEGGRDMISGSNAWLAQNGFWLFNLGAVGEYSFVGASHYASDPVPPIPYIAVGPTIRSKNPHQTHTVVMAEGKVVYDPHPSEVGLLAETHRYLITPILSTVL